MTCFKTDAVNKESLGKNEELKQNKNILDGIFSAVMISTIFILMSCTVIYYTNPGLIEIIYGEHSDFMHSIKKEQSVNQTQSLDSYNFLITNNYPYPVHFVDKLDWDPAIIYDGVVISNNSKAERIQFSNWGISNNLNLYNFSGPHKNISFFTIKGNTYDNSAGFMSSSLNYSDRYVSLNLGNIYKYPQMSQVSIQLNVVGELNNYNLFFVNGRLGYENWVDNNLYKEIRSNSSLLVDLVDLLSSKGDKFLYLNGISVNIEKNTEIESFPFRIDFGKSTVNTPDILFGKEPFFVNGFIFEGDVISNDFRYLFDDWEFKQVLNQEFVVNSSYHHLIAPNNWDIKQLNESKDNLTNDLHIKLESEKIIPLLDAPILHVFPHLDVYNSLLQFGSSKDILFVIILVALITLALQKREKTVSRVN